MKEITKNRLEKVLKELGVANPRLLHLIDKYGLTLEDEDLLSVIDAYENSGVKNIKYFDAIVNNKIKEVIMKTAKERKSMGTPPKEDY